MLRNRAVLAVVAMLAVTLPNAGVRAAAWEPRAATYSVVIERDHSITMSDGIRLIADIRFPGNGGTKAPGRFPVLLTQTPYNKAATGLNFASDYLVQRGYVQVIVDVRGTGGSEGVWDSFGTREQLDGKELVEWAADAPFSTGSVGLHGTSYGAINQLLTAAQQPRGLKALFPIVPMSDTYRDIVGSGGLVNTSFIPSWLGLVTGLGLLPPTFVATDPVRALATVAGHAGGATTFQIPMILKALADDDVAYDGPFHRSRSPIEVIDRVQAPTFVVGGWWDLFQRGEPLLFERLAANGVPSRLLMGPWYHTSPGLSSGLPRDGVPGLDALELRWMDRYVRGDADDAMDADIAPVTAFRLLNDGYQTFSQWPPVETDYIAARLDGNGEAMLGAVHGALTFDEVSGAEGASLIYQPLSGVCSRSTAQWTASGTRAGCEEDERANVLGGLTYDLPVSSDLELAGPIGLELDVRTNDRDGFITARLEQVDPATGRVTHLTGGWQLVSHRALDEAKTLRSEDGLLVRPYHPFSRTAELPVTSGATYSVGVELFPTFARIPAGQILRLSLQSSDAPHLTPSAPRVSRLAGSVLTILDGSTLTLPIVR